MLERRLLTQLSRQHFSDTIIDDLVEIPTDRFETIQRLWGVIVAGIKHTDYEFKEFLRHHTTETIKAQVLDIIAFQRMQPNYKKGEKTTTMIKTLANFANQSHSYSLQVPKCPTASTTLVAARQTTTTVTTTTTNEMLMEWSVKVG